MEGNAQNKILKIAQLQKLHISKICTYTVFVQLLSSTTGGSPAQTITLKEALLSTSFVNYHDR